MTIPIFQIRRWSSKGVAILQTFIACYSQCFYLYRIHKCKYTQVTFRVTRSDPPMKSQSVNSSDTEFLWLCFHWSFGSFLVLLVSFFIPLANYTEPILNKYFQSQRTNHHPFARRDLTTFLISSLGFPSTSELPKLNGYAISSFIPQSIVDISISCIMSYLLYLERSGTQGCLYHSIFHSSTGLTWFCFILNV